MMYRGSEVSRVGYLGSRLSSDYALCGLRAVVVVRESVIAGEEVGVCNALLCGLMWRWRRAGRW